MAGKTAGYWGKRLSMFSSETFGGFSSRTPSTVLFYIASVNYKTLPPDSHDKNLRAYQILPIVIRLLNWHSSHLIFSCLIIKKFARTILASSKIIENSVELDD